MKKFTVLMIILFLTFNLIKAQIASFNFNATPYISASANNANLIVNNIQLSTGTISTNITTGSYFTNEPYIEASGGWTATSALTAKYFYVNITAQAGYRFSLTNISFDMYATAAGPSGASILLDNTSIHTTNVSSAALQSISKPIEGYTKLTYVTLKIAGWNNGSRATAGTGILKIDNLIINGLVELIPPNDSSSSIMPTSFSIPNVISSVTNNAFIPVMELAIVDSATADGISTFIDSLKIKAGLNNQFTNFTEIISQASWVCNNYADTVKGVISNNSITFHTPSFEIPEGLLNTDTCRLLIALKKNLPNADGKKLGFVLDSTHVFCKPSGSKVGWGKVDTGIDNLKVQVLATRLSVNLEPDLVWKDSLFQIKIEAVDSYGNLDTDENGNVGVVLDKGEGVLQSATSLSSFFIQGKALFNGLKFTGSDTISLKMQSTKFEDYLISDHLVGKPLFIDDFESAMLSTWKNTNDWTVSTLNPISNAHSLKHNLSGVEGYSYLTSEYFSPVMNHGKTVWRMVLKNGNFDPTSTNRFWYFLMASDSNLLSTNNYGYAVGVNFSGSNDTLSLWKLDSTGTKTILLSSNFEWNENETVAVEVIREVSGSWRIGYSESSDFDNLNYSARFNENTFVDLPYHGLVFQYSNTRSGLLWVDNISVFQLNTPPTMTKVKVIQADTVLLYFSEPLNQTEAVIISNYKIFSESDKEVYLLGLRFDVNQPNCVKLAISNLKTAQYTIHSSNLKDMDGSIMLPDSLSFSYEVPAKLADVVFTEIMFDPSPSAGLPETDYLEIYNRSKNPINLNGWKLNIGGLIKTFPDTVIREGEYITLSNAAFSKQFAEFGKFIGLISITELTNLGKAVRLISNTGLLIDSIFYRPYWITDEQKLDGGWSLERIDPNNCCGESVNWNVSNNPKGGTPGAVNSISKPNLDTFSPHLIKWNQLSMRHLEFYFNEEIDAKSLNKNYFLGLSSSVDIVDSLVLSSNLKTVSIYLSDSIKPDRKYEFTLSHFSDLCGNTFSDTVLEFLHHPIVQYDIVFNEIMSDAEPSNGLPETDYLEIFNRSNFPLNLQNIELWLGTTRKVFPEIKLLPDSFLIVCQAGQSNAFSGFGQAVELLSSSSLTATDKSLMLKDTSGLKIDSVYYQSSWYQNPEKVDGGWSLERIDPDNFCGTLGNWHASENESGGTPGSQNSVFKPNNDTVPPRLTHIQITGFNQIQLTFSENVTIPTNLENGSVRLSGFSVDSLNLNLLQQSIIRVYFDTVFQSGQFYNIDIYHFIDKCGNSCKDTIVKILFYLPKPNDIVINEIMADPTPPIGLPEVSYIELFNHSKHPINLVNFKLKYSSYSRTFPDLVLDSGAFVLLCPTGKGALLAEYGNVLDILSSTTLTNSGRLLELADTSGQVISSINYNTGWYQNPDKANGGWSLERVNPNIFTADSSNWQTSFDIRGGTPGLANSLPSLTIDSIAPLLLHWKMISTTFFEFEFSEPIGGFTRDTNLILSFLSSDAAIKSIQTCNDSRLLRLSLSNPIKKHQKYEIALAGISDLSGNVINDTVLHFIYNPVGVSDLVFNEIMADASPPAGLPESDYFELFNRSNFTLNLENIELWIGSTRKVFPKIELLPDSFLIVCQTGQSASFSGFGNVVELLSSSSLTATDKSLVLKDTSGNAIDSVYYQISWYQNPDKEDGGWSLERIDPNNFCSTLANWQASESEKGGTPGHLNSVYKSNQDTLKPYLRSLKIETDSSIRIEFSELLDRKSLHELSNYKLEDHTSLIDSLLVINNKTTDVLLFLNQPFTIDGKFALQIKNMVDLCGNLMNDTLLHFEFTVAKRNDLVFSELMIDPSPVIGMPEYEYVEIYNRSTKKIELENWQWVVNGSVKKLPQLTLLPQSFLAIVSNTVINEFGFVINKTGISSFPALPNTTGNMQLLDASGQLINEIQYDINWYNNEDKKDGGWSMEIIDPNNQCGEVCNWQASLNPMGGTPGAINSVNAKNIDTLAPRLVKAIPITNNTLLLQFSEVINRISLSPSNFFVDALGVPSQISIDTMDESLLSLNFKNTFEPHKNYELSLSGINDNCDNEMRNTLTNFTYYNAQLYNVVINEIMANPEPTKGLPELEYIELYNNTMYEIQGYQWQIAVGSSIQVLPNITIEANSYLVLYNTDYPTPFPSEIKAIGVIDLPALPLSGNITIFNSKNELICQTAYESAWFIDDFKSEGGFSLERIDYNNPNETIQNWQASNNELGGTPGKINSVYQNNPDVTPPDLIRAFPVNDTLMGLQFSEPMNSATVTLNEIQVINELNLIDSVFTQNNNLSIFYLAFNNPLLPGVMYSIRVSETLTDIAGNALVNRDATLMLPIKASPNDLVISELLWNPLDGGVDFVELYNRSAFTVNLKQFFVASYDEEGNIKTPKRITNQGALLFPSEYVVLSENQALIKQHYWIENHFAFMDVESLPSYSNTEGSVVIIDTNGVVIDYLYYSDDMHFGLLKDTKGVSLERIQADLSSQEKSNWHSAAEKAGWATPGYKNSMAVDEIEGDGTITMDRDAFSPDGDGNNDILYINYRLDEPGYVANITLFDAKGRKTKTLANNELLGTSGILAWDGLTDGNQKAAIGIYIIYIELFNLQGTVKKYKKVCAVNGRLD